MGPGTGRSLQPHSRDLGNILIIFRNQSHCNEVLLCQHRESKKDTLTWKLPVCRHNL